MIVNFQFTLADYRNAFRAHYGKGASAFTRWMLRLVLVVGVLFLLLSVLFVITGQRALNVVLPHFFLERFGPGWGWERLICFLPEASSQKVLHCASQDALKLATMA
jgi:hypothetical protein